MQVSYVGTALNDRLTLWVPESEHGSQFLLRRTGREPGVVGFWAIVPKSAACQISNLLGLGCCVEATSLLKATVIDCGQILPPEDEVVPTIDQRA